MASVKVAVRVRPFNKRELNMSSDLIVNVSGAEVHLDPPTKFAPRETSTPLSETKSRAHKFAFDYAYWSHDKQDKHFVGQETVYNDLGTDVVENAFSGYNACVFAYGQTGSGKTYTMMGSGEGEERGLIPRICQNMFDKMREGKQEGTTYRTEVSYLEIYNERVKDLLRNASTEHNLKVREHPTKGPYVENLSKHLVIDYSDIRSLMERGNEVRTTACTNMNDTSSRSHAIFTITFVNAGFFQGVPHETVSKIHLVDLAGSERADATGATGQRLKEGAHINKSLVTLGSVISALAEASNVKNNAKETKMQKSVFIPYRDSVLTWLLKDSLGGNSKTIMIATISPAHVNHGETLSTLRYANRAKNIINKPTINEDPNVRLIRELRDEIERLRSMMSLDPDTLSNVQKQLAVKEAQERHLTEEWTEKWKEAANILKEQRALALKRTGLGVMLDSVKPHLVGIDEDVLSTGITLYHLKDGETVIGSGEGAEAVDIELRGPSIAALHCEIHLHNGSATLVPMPDSLCMVNAALVTEPTKLSQGCVIVLGKTNMFRYNDPREAENMRKNRTDAVGVNRSLLSQSLSDLRQSVGLERTKERLNPKLHCSEGDIKENDESSSSSESTFVSNTHQDAINNNDRSDVTAYDGDASSSSMAKDDDMSTTAGSSKEDVAEEMNELYKSIGEQKNVIMKCLESEQCDISTLNKQIAILQGMQDNYSKLEYEITRNMWMSTHSNASGPMSDDEGVKTFDEQFSLLVEQEVDRRIFQEKVLRVESEFHDKEMLRIQKEREIVEIRRQHEKEIYMLKKRLHEATVQAEQENRDMINSSSATFPVTICIPSFHISTQGQFVEFEVIIKAKDATWTVRRRFRQFRDLHMMMGQIYGGAVHSLSFPHRRLFGSLSESVSVERQKQLQTYLNALVQRCSLVPSCPIHKKPLQEAMAEFSEFFRPN